MKISRFDESSLIKDDLNLVDSIRKSLIKIENEHPKEEEIHQLLGDAISYLNKDLSVNAANELYTLILSCFSHYPNQLLSIYQKLLELPTKNCYHILITASILSYLSRVHPQLSLTEHYSFADDALNQLISQIKKNDENALKMFDHRNFHFSSITSKSQTSNFTTNLFSHDMTKNTSNLEKILDGISEDKFISDIHQRIITNGDFSFESINNCTSHISDQSCKSIFSQNDHKNLNSKRSDQTFSKHIQTEQDSINELQLYLNVFSSIRTRYPFLSSPTFWVHICSIASKSKISISRKMANQFHFYFERFVDEVKFDQVLNAIIFSKETQNSIGMEFITQMIFSPKPLIKQNYLFNVELTELLFKILQTKIAFKSCFWRLFSKSLIFREFQKTKNPLLLYGYEFAIGKFEHQFESIEVKPQTDRSIIDLYDYLLQSEKNYEADESACEEAVSLIASAFIFARKEGNTRVDGLTKETVFPFLTIAFDHINRFCIKEKKHEVLVNFLNYFKCGQNFSLIKQACKSLENNDSPLLVISINRILPFLSSLLDPNFFSFRFSLTIIQILMPFLLNNKYLADKMVLLMTIFEFSSENDDSNLLLLFKKFQLQLFEFILKNLSQIIQCNELKKKPLNLNVFDDSISLFVSDSIQNSSSLNDSILLIQFIESFCVNQPIFKFESTEICEKILNETIQNEMKIECSLVYQFMVKNGLINDFHHLIDRPFILSNIQPEAIHIINRALFNKMVKNRSISTSYFAFLLHKIINENCTNNLSAEQILNFEFLGEFDDTFIDAINSFFVFDQRTRKFVLKTEPESPILFDSGIEFDFISNLLSLTIQKEDQFNAFVILKSLAESFPFLFVGFSHQIFDSVLPALDNFLFDENQQEELRTKMSISALSFLFSALKNPEILDDFVCFFFCNVERFTDSQILSFSIVLNELIKADSVVKNIMVSQLIKNDFIEKVFSIIKRNLNDCSFANFFMEKICSLTLIFLKSLRCMTQNDAVFIDEMMKVEKPFQTVFGHYSNVNFESLSKTFSESSKNDKMVKFAGEIDSIKPFWISFDFKQRQSEEINDDKINVFLSKFANQNTPRKMSKFLSQIQKPLTISMIKHLARKPRWISLYIEKPENFILLSEHIEILNKTVSELNSIQKENEDENELNFEKANQNKEKVLIEFVLKATTNAKIDGCSFLSFCDLFKEVAQKEADFQSLLKSFSFCLKKLISVDSMQKAIEILLCLSKCNTDLFIENFTLSCGNDLIDAVLTPKFRTEGEIYLKISKLLSMLDQNHMPNRIVDFISFVVSSFNDPSIISSSLLLCEKVDDLKKKPLNPLILNLIENSIEIESETITILPILFDQFPSNCRSKMSQILELLDVLLMRYRKVGDHFTTEIKEEEKKTVIFHEEKKKQNKKSGNEENKASACNRDHDEDDKKHLKIQKKNILKEKVKSNILNKNKNGDESKLLLELIEAIFKFVAPKRVQPRTVDIKPSSEGEIPEAIFNLSPDFWKLFDKHRSFITETIVKKPTLLGSAFSFLHNFPELLDYDIRYSYFAESRRKIARESVLKLTVRTTNILTDSFNLLNPLSTEDLTRDLYVYFKGENERVQNDIYFSLLIKELFDPRNYFFVYTENRRSFQINPRSDVIRKHIDYFRFAGKILARAMLEDQMFNIKMTSSIFKMLLKRPLDITDLKDIDFDLYTELKAKLEEDNNDNKKADKKNDDGVFFTLGFGDEEEEEEESPDSPFESDQISSENNQKENRNQMYVDSKIEHRLHEPIIDQITAFCDGFYQIIPYSKICPFLPSEFDHLFRGLPFSISSTAEELIQSVEIVPPLTHESPTVRAFFAAARSWDDDRLSQLLFFVTRSNSISFKKLKESGNPIKIGLGDKIDLPKAHPFVNLLLLPECDDQNLLNWKFFIVFNEIDSKPSPSIRKVRSKKKKSSCVSD